MGFEAILEHTNFSSEHPCLFVLINCDPACITLLRRRGLSFRNRFKLLADKTSPVDSKSGGLLFAKTKSVLFQIKVKY